MFKNVVTALRIDKDETIRELKELETMNVEMAELTVPFSDPVAESKEVQEESIEALENACSIDKIFKALPDICEKTNIPIILSFYINTAYRYGYDDFCKKACKCGIKYFKIKDLPYEERDEIKQYIDFYDIKLA